MLLGCAVGMGCAEGMCCWAVSEFSIQQCNTFPFQIKYCRFQLGSMHSSPLLKFEHKIINLIFGRQRLQIGFAVCLAFEMDMAGQKGLYIRYMQHGALYGLVEELKDYIDNSIKVPVVLDCVLTNSDVQCLSSNPTKNQATDTKVAFSAFSGFCTQCDGVEFGAICVVDKNFENISKQKLSVTYDIPWEKLLQQVIPNPRHASSISLITTMLSNTTAELNFNEQLRLLNVLPAQQIMSCNDKRAIGYKLYVAWPLLSPKGLMVEHSVSMEKVVECLQNCVSFGKKKQSKRKPATKRKRTCQMPFLKRLHKTTTLAKRLLLTSSELPTSVFTPKMAPLDIFQGQLTSKGRVRVVERSPSSISLYWNKFDSLSSELQILRHLSACAVGHVLLEDELCGCAMCCVDVLWKCAVEMCCGDVLWRCAVEMCCWVVCVLSQHIRTAHRHSTSPQHIHIAHPHSTSSNKAHPHSKSTKHIHTAHRHPIPMLTNVNGFLSGQIVAHEFVTTTVKWSEEDGGLVNSELDYTSCQGCSMFSDSLQLLLSLTRADADELDGWCVHTMSIAALVPVLFQEEQLEQQSSFAAFVSHEVEMTDVCSVISKSATSVIFLAMVNVEKARSEEVARCSTCTFRLLGSQWSATCSNVRCKRGKNKMIKGVNELNSVCCHLQQAIHYWQTESIPSQPDCQEDNDLIFLGDDEGDVDYVSEESDNFTCDEGLHVTRHMHFVITSIQQIPTPQNIHPQSIT